VPALSGRVSVSQATLIRGYPKNVRVGLRVVPNCGTEAWLDFNNLNNYCGFLHRTKSFGWQNQAAFCVSARLLYKRCGTAALRFDVVLGGRFIGV
jgi:hypothetical protein